MSIKSPLVVETIEGAEIRDDSEIAEKMRKFVEDRIYVLKKAASHNPQFKLSLNDRIFFMRNGFRVHLDFDKSKNYEREISLVPSSHGVFKENRADLKHSQHNTINQNYETVLRPNWKNFGGNEEN